VRDCPGAQRSRKRMIRLPGGAEGVADGSQPLLISTPSLSVRVQARFRTGMVALNCRTLWRERNDRLVVWVGLADRIHQAYDKCRASRASIPRPELPPLRAPSRQSDSDLHGEAVR